MAKNYLNAYISNLPKKLLNTKKPVNMNNDDILFVIDMQNDFIPIVALSDTEGAFAVT